MKAMTRAKVMQIWFAAVTLIVVAGIASGVSVTIATGAVLLTLCLVPGAIIWMLWPVAQSPTVGDVIRGTDRRP